MANRYHRKLLTEFNVADIEKRLRDAMLYLNDAGIPNKLLRDALVSRLELRLALLSAVQIDDIVDPQRSSSWERCLELLPTIPGTITLGTPVVQSFSIKIQRRLASSVPPRPIVNISYSDAFVQLTNLCHNARDAYRILDYRGASQLIVRSISVDSY